MTTIELGDLTFSNSGSGYQDSEGVRWWLEELDGWATPPPSRVSRASRAGADGDQTTAVHYSGKLIRITGFLVAPSERARDVAVDDLIAAVDLSVPEILKVNLRDQARQVEVVRDSEPCDITPLKKRSADFVVPLFSDDPYRYDQTAQVEAFSFSGFSQTKSVSPGGAKPTRNVVVDFQSPVVDPSVTIDGRVVALELSVPSGGVTFDLYHRAVTAAGVNVLHLVDVPDGWPILTPGSNSITAARGSDAGTGVASASIRPAYL